MSRHLSDKDDNRRPGGREAELEAEILRLRQALDRAGLGEDPEALGAALRQANAELEAAQARATGILESIDDAFYAVDTEWRFTYVNRKAEQWWARCRETLIGKVLWEEFPQLVGTGIQATHFSAARERQVMALEALSPVLHHWVDIRIYPGEAGGLSVYFRDITERRAAEESRRASEEMLRLSQRAARVGSFERDFRAGTLCWSAETYAMYGLPAPADERAPVPVATWTAAIHPEDRARVGAEIAAALAGRLAELTLQYRIRRADTGAVRHLEARSRYSYDAEGQSLRAVGAAIDVTERHLAEAALAASEAEFRAAFEQSAVPMHQTDCATGRLLRVNAAFCRLVGRPAEQLLGRHVSDTTHPEDRETNLAAFLAMVRGELGVYEAEKRYLRPDGTVRWTHFSSTLVRNAAGRPLRTVAVAQDITERKEAEARQALLAREVDHRAKNALAVVQAALRLTQAPDVPSYVRTIEGRVAALARAQTLLAQDRWAGAKLRALIRGEMAAFRGTGQQVELDGPEVALPAGAAQPLAMAMHELATNAVKHGALSVPEGRVSVSWRLTGPAPGVLRLRWAEADGPEVPGPPQRRGFGSRVLDGTIRTQLGGRVSLAWEPAGLVCEIEVPLDRLRGGSAELPPGRDSEAAE